MAPEPFGQPFRLRPVGRVEVVAVGKHLEVEIREENPGKPGGYLPVVVRMAQSAEGKEHGLGESCQP